MADIQTGNIMKSMNLTYSHKELQWLFFAAVVAGLNASLRKRGYFITFKVSDDSFCYEFWKAASVAEKGDGEMIASHQVNKGEYQMNDIRLAIMIKYMEDEANKFMVAISQLTLKDYDTNGRLSGTESKMSEISGKWGTAKFGRETVLTCDGVMMTSLTWEDIAGKLNKATESDTADGLLFTNWHTAKEIPGVKEEGQVAHYVLIDLYGYRKPEDFEIGFYNIAQERWCLKYSNRYPDLDHMKWTELPLNKGND